MSEQRVYNRDSFLNTLSNELGRKTPTYVERPQWKHDPRWQVFQEGAQDELVHVFMKQCKINHTDAYETDKKGLAHAVSHVIHHYNGESVATWDDDRFKYYDVFSETPSNTHIHTWNPKLGEENLKHTEQADLGITFCDMALAESGTVVLYSDERRGRSISLLPTTYIAIVPKSTLVPRMSDATREIHRGIKDGNTPPTCVNFISGPSNSADIEMNLVVGVHGPIKATYIIVSDL